MWKIPWLDRSNLFLNQKFWFVEEKFTNLHARDFINFIARSFRFNLLMELAFVVETNVIRIDLLDEIQETNDCAVSFSIFHSRESRSRALKEHEKVNNSARSEPSIFSVVLCGAEMRPLTNKFLWVHKHSLTLNCFKLLGKANDEWQKNFKRLLNFCLINVTANFHNKLRRKRLSSRNWAPSKSNQIMEISFAYKRANEMIAMVFVS